MLCWKCIRMNYFYCRSGNFLSLSTVATLIIPGSIGNYWSVITFLHYTALLMNPSQLNPAHVSYVTFQVAQNSRIWMSESRLLIILRFCFTRWWTKPFAACVTILLCHILPLTCLKRFREIPYLPEKFICQQRLRPDVEVGRILKRVANWWQVLCDARSLLSLPNPFH